MKDNFQPVTEINLGALCENALILKKTVGDFYCVLKCDAYGHGDINCARALSEAGFDRFAVFSVREAERIRRFAREILILGRSEKKLIRLVAERGYIQTVSSFEYLEELQSVTDIPHIHLKLDCGMNRSGFRCNPEEILSRLGHVRDKVCGIYTHFHSADCPELNETKSELKDFIGKSDFLRDALGNEILRHAAASSAALRLPEARFDLCRMGIALYGCVPDNCVGPVLKPVMGFYGRITETRFVKKGENIGYGTGNRAEKDMLVATVASGYASGLRRALYGRYRPLVCGYPVSFAGKICMDRCMLDLTEAAENGLFPKTGDRVEFFGENKGVAEMASASETISYEILTGIGGCCRQRMLKK